MQGFAPSFGQCGWLETGHGVACFRVALSGVVLMRGFRRCWSRQAEWGGDRMSSGAAMVDNKRRRRFLFAIGAGVAAAGTLYYVYCQMQEKQKKEDASRKQEESSASGHRSEGPEATQRPVIRTEECTSNITTPDVSHNANALDSWLPPGDGMGTSRSGRDWLPPASTILSGPSEALQSLSEPSNANSSGVGEGGATDMVQNMLTPEALHAPLKERLQQYREFLSENRLSMPVDDYARYTLQSSTVEEIIYILENHPSDLVKLLDMMQRLQTLGDPPAEFQ